MKLEMDLVMGFQGVEVIIVWYLEHEVRPMISVVVFRA